MRPNSAILTIRKVFKKLKTIKYKLNCLVWYFQLKNLEHWTGSGRILMWIRIQFWRWLNSRFGSRIQPQKGSELESIRSPGTLISSQIMVLIFDGNSEYVAHAWRKIGLFEKNIRFVTALNLIKCIISRSNNRDCSLRVHLFLYCHLI